MENDLLKIKDKISKFAPFKNINPHKHWINLVRVFFVFVILLIIFSFFLLFEIRNQQIFQVSENKEKIQGLINENLLKKINESFDLRAVKEKNIKEGFNTYKDPSI